MGEWENDEAMSAGEKISHMLLDMAVQGAVWLELRRTEHPEALKAFGDYAAMAERYADAVREYDATGAVLETLLPPPPLDLEDIHEAAWTTGEN